MWLVLYIITLSIYCYYSTISEAVFVSRFTTRTTRDESLPETFGSPQATKIVLGETSSLHT
jgi:hypothetical protein